MKKLKRIIICMVIILIILVIMLLNLLNKNNQSSTQNSYNETSVIAENKGDFIANSEYIEVTSPTTYYTVKEYVDNFFSDLKSASSDSDLEKLLDILNIKYVNENGINKNNIKNKLLEYEKYNYYISNIYQQGKEEFFVTFLIRGKFENNVDFNIIMNVDYNVGTYDINLNSEDKEINTEEIKANSNNLYKNKAVEDKDMCEMYLSDFKKKVNEDINESYNVINSIYKDSKFKSMDLYKKYISKNIVRISEANVNLYKVNISSDGSRQYIIIDSKGMYYIVNAKSVMNYNIMLDSYTVPLDEIVKKYSSVSEAEKACLCLETLKEMINTNDYSKIYSHLNNTFKSNYFSSQEELEKNITEKFYENNKFEYIRVEQLESNYIVTVKISKYGDDNNSNIIEKTFIIKLGEDISDFELSFSMN